MAAKATERPVEGRLAKIRPIPYLARPQVGGRAATHAKEAVLDAYAVAWLTALLGRVEPVVGVRPLAGVGGVADAVPQLLTLLTSGVPGQRCAQTEPRAETVAATQATDPTRPTVLRGLATAAHSDRNRRRLDEPVCSCGRCKSVTHIKSKD